MESQHTLSLDIPLSSEDLDSKEQKETPMTNSVILIAVFKHLGLNDVKSCRLVCRDWHDSSFLGLRRCARIYVDNKNSVDELKGLTGLHELENFRLNVSNKDGNMLLTKFVDSPNTSAMLELTITCFKITNDILAFLSYFPGLETLTFVRRRNHTGYLQSILPKTRFCKQRIRGPQFLKLKRLTCSNISVVDSYNLAEIFLAAPNLREIATNDAIINYIVWQNLAIWSRTLESLEIKHLQAGNSLPLHQSLTLSKLARLIVVGGDMRCPDSTWAPKLEIAVFDYVNLHTLFPDDLGNTFTVKTLQIENSSIGQWAGFTSQRFPFLKILNFPSMSHTLFRMVCKNLKTLEELHVGAWVSDSSITGFPRYIRHIRHGFVQDVKNKRAFTVGNYRKHASVADLPGLKQISIRGNNEITEACILLGLVHCKSLDTIKIDWIPEISMETIHAIGSKLPSLKNLKIRTSNLRGNEASVAIAHLSKKIPNCVVEF